MNHVAEVDEPHDALMACRRIVAAADEHVVIVRIVVDRRSPQSSEQTRVVSFNPGRHPLDEGAQILVLHQSDALPDDGETVGQIPVEVAMDGGVIERGQRAIHGTDPPPEILEQRR